MKATRNFMVLAVLLFVGACVQESKRARIEREAREFTEKNCPRSEYQDLIFLDSIVCHDDGVSDYVCHYSVKGDSVMMEQLKSQYDELKDRLLQGIRNSIDLRFVKDEGLDIIYSYSNAETGEKVVEFRFKAKDYQ